MEIKYKAIDLMERTMANWAIMDELHAARRNRDAPQPYEVTQLVNSFLGALAYPWEDLKIRAADDEPWNLPMSVLNQRYGFPTLTKAKRGDTDPSDFRDTIRQLRNGMAHGNIRFYSDHRREVHQIEIWNEYKNKRTWGTFMTMDELRQFLNAFYRFAQDPLVDVIPR